MIEIGNKPISANSRSARATLEFMDGNYDTAARLWSEADAIAESIGNFWGRAMSLGSSAWIPARSRSRFRRAAAHLARRRNSRSRRRLRWPPTSSAGR